MLVAISKLNAMQTRKYKLSFALTSNGARKILDNLQEQRIIVA
jgi:hypothetical protein